jgi:hypothetical protein
MPQSDPEASSALDCIAVDHGGCATADVDANSASGDSQPSYRDPSRSNQNGVQRGIWAVDGCIAATIQSDQILSYRHLQIFIAGAIHLNAVTRAGLVYRSL